MRVKLHDQTAVLLSSAALLFEELGRTLVIADVHLGKSAAFRARGLAVPEGDTRRDLERIRSLVIGQRVGHLVIAGDLFHSRAGTTPEIIAQVDRWLAELPCPATLVVGNHDAKLAQLPDRIATVPRLRLAEVRVVHDPTKAEAGPFTVGGHLHPVIRVADGRRSSLRLPCFHLSANRLVLPAFGSFTGGHRVKPTKDERIFVFPGHEVIEIPPPLWR